MAIFALAVGAMEGIEQGRVDEGTWPDHAGRPDDELTKETTEREAQNLSTQRNEGRVGEGQLLVVEDLLGRDDFGGVCSPYADIGHNSYAYVLLNAERSWVQRPCVSKRLELLCGENEGKAFPEGKR